MKSIFRSAISRSVSVLLALLFLMGLRSQAQDIVSAIQAADGKIEITINEPLIGSADQPIVKIFEITGVGKNQKTFEVRPLSETQGVSGGKFIATVTLPPRASFNHYDFEVLNHRTSTDVEVFRGSVILNLSATIVPPATANKIRVRFAAPSSFHWQKLRTWIVAASKGATATVTLQNGQSDTYNVIDASIENVPDCPRLQAGDTFVTCFLSATLELDRSLPAGLAVNITLKFRDDAFPPNDIADNLLLEQFHRGITGKVGTSQALAAGKDRDPIRTNVVEVGGSYSTSFKLDKDPTSTKPPKRKTDGTLDLRLATPTIFFRDEIEKWWSWTPVQFDGMISTRQTNRRQLSDEHDAIVYASAASDNCQATQR